MTLKDVQICEHNFPGKIAGEGMSSKTGNLTQKDWEALYEGGNFNSIQAVLAFRKLEWKGNGGFGPNGKNNVLKTNQSKQIYPPEN